jgi:hypothetical protein
MVKKNQIGEILASLREMLEELTEKELNIVDQHITNHYGEVSIDSEGNYSNMFRDLICEPLDNEIYHWNPVYE